MTDQAQKTMRATHVNRVHDRRGHPDIVIYRQQQVVVQPEWTAEDQAKLTLMRFMNAARKTIQARVNSLPGSYASTELWLRYRQIEDAAASVGKKGAWSQALQQFQSQYALLLTAVPKGDAEPIGRGVSGNACGCGPGQSCVACRGKRAYADLMGLLVKAQDALVAGRPQEALALLNRSKQLYHKCEPKDAPLAASSIRVVADKLNASMGRTDALRGVSGARIGRGVGDFGDLSWLAGELDTIKAATGRTGDVTRNLALAQSAYAKFQPRNEVESAQGNAIYGQAAAYISSFRSGSEQLTQASDNATGAIQQYHASMAGQYAQESEEEARRLRLAATHPWLYAVPEGIPGSKAVVDSLASTLDQVSDAFRQASFSGVWGHLPAVVKIAGVGVVGYGAYRAAKAVKSS